MYAIKEENTPETVRERSEEMTLRKSPPLQRRIQRESLPIEISRPKGVVPTILEEQVKKMSIHEIPQLPTESDLAVPMLLPVATGSPRLEMYIYLHISRLKNITYTAMVCFLPQRN